MAFELFRFPNKSLRAQGIKEYMRRAGYDRAVCFSCGNASARLKAVGVDLLDISTGGDLIAGRWFTQSEIKRWFPECFDATSGHLPLECMIDISRIFKRYLRKIPGEIFLPTGSGETLVELKMAFPACKINAVYNLDAATEYSVDCVLNGMVELMAERIIFADKEKG